MSKIDKYISESIQNVIEQSSIYTQDMFDRMQSYVYKQADSLALQRSHKLLFGNNPICDILEMTSSILLNNEYIDWCGLITPFEDVQWILQKLSKDANIDISDYERKVDQYRGDGDFVSDNETQYICNLLKSTYKEHSQLFIDNLLKNLKAIKNKKTVNDLYNQLIKELPSYTFRIIADKFMQIFKINEPKKKNKEIKSWELYIAVELANQIKTQNLLTR